MQDATLVISDVADNVTLVISDVADNVTLVISDVIPLKDFIQKNVINAKGDLIIGDEDAEPTNLPIGSPNYFLVVDPTQDRGYKFTNTIDCGTF